MPVSTYFNSGDMIRFLPEIILTVMGTVLMVLDPLLGRRSSSAFGTLSLFTLVAALAGSVYAYTQAGPAFGGMLIVDGFATFFRVLVIVVGILTILPSFRFLARQDAETSEYHALLLFSIAGQCVMVSANELIMIFIGLEISSIASYVLAGYLREAGVIAVPHPKWDERPIAAVVLRSGTNATPDELREFLASRFAKWQLPDAFVFLDELPHTSTGKLSKLELRKRFADWQWERSEDKGK